MNSATDFAPKIDVMYDRVFGTSIDVGLGSEKGLSQLCFSP